MALYAKSGNPAFSDEVFRDWSGAAGREGAMTVQGTAVKSLILTAILMVTASWSWAGVGRGDMTAPMLFGSAIVGAIVALATIFKPAWAPVTAPIYAAAQGVFLGAISHVFNQRYQGIVVNAVSLTVMTLLIMLVLYSSGTIKVTQKLRAGIMAATGALALFYLIVLLLGVFHVGGGFVGAVWGSGPLGLVVSVVAVGLASFNLLLDFDSIEQGARYGAPRAMEWYGAFGLMMTLIWLYLELLRLLAKLQDRR